MVRRVIALGVGVLILILSARGQGLPQRADERGLENYAPDLESIVDQSNQLSADFFARLDEPEGEDELTLEAQIAADRGNAEALLQRVDGLDTPDELSDAQAELEQAFELRRDALADIADADHDRARQRRAHGGDRADRRRHAGLLGQRRSLRPRAGRIETELTDQGVDSKVPESQLPSGAVERWLDDLQLTTVLSAFATNAGATSGVHGLAVLSTRSTRRR